MRRLGVAVVGLHYGSKFLGLYQQHEALELVGVVGARASAAREIAEFVGCRAFRTLEDALACDDVQVVHLCTPPALHAEQALACVRSGRHTLVAPPLAFDEREVRLIVQEARSADVLVALAETDVFSQGFQALQLVVAGRLVGAVRSVHGYHEQDMSAWPAYWRDVQPLQYATHAVAPVLSGLRSSPARVRGRTVGTYEDGRPSCQRAEIILVRSGIRVSVEVNFTPAGSGFRKGVVVTGSDGTFDSGDKDQVAQVLAGHGVRRSEDACPIPEEYPLYRVHGRDQGIFQMSTASKESHRGLVCALADAIGGPPELRAQWTSRSAEWARTGLLGCRSANNGAAWIPMYTNENEDSA